MNKLFKLEIFTTVNCSQNDTMVNGNQTSVKVSVSHTNVPCKRHALWKCRTQQNVSRILDPLVPLSAFLCFLFLSHNLFFLSLHLPRFLLSLLEKEQAGQARSVSWECLSTADNGSFHWFWPLLFVHINIKACPFYPFGSRAFTDLLPSLIVLTWWCTHRICSKSIHTKAVTDICILINTVSDNSVFMSISMRKDDACS